MIPSNELAIPWSNTQASWSILNDPFDFKMNYAGEETILETR